MDVVESVDSSQGQAGLRIDRHGVWTREAGPLLPRVWQVCAQDLSPLLMLVLGTLPMVAQDSLLLSLTGNTAVQERTRELHDVPYTVRWGKFQLQASASLAGQWNDNVNLSESDPERDFIISPMGSIDAYWPITDLNALTFSIGAGYNFYVDHDRYSYASLVPGSQLAWNIYIGDFGINVHDRFSYSQDPTAYGAASGTARLGGLDNTVGLLVTWDLKDVVLSVGYDHFDFIASPSHYENLDRSSEFGLFRAGLHVHPAVKIGLEATGGPTTYRTGTAGDNVTFSIGAFADWTLTEHIRLQPRVGYYRYLFDEQRMEDQDGIYFSLRMEHDLRHSFFYFLEGGHRAYMGNLSYLTEEWYGDLGISWFGIKNLSVTTDFYYENATQPFGNVSDDYDRYSWNLRLSCPIKKKLRVSAAYAHWLKDSEHTQGGYTQNSVTLQVTYRF